MTAGNHAMKALRKCPRSKCFVAIPYCERALTPYLAAFGTQKGQETGERYELRFLLAPLYFFFIPTNIPVQRLRPLKHNVKMKKRKSDVYCESTCGASLTSQRPIYGSIHARPCWYSVLRTGFISVHLRLTLTKLQFLILTSPQ